VLAKVYLGQQRGIPLFLLVDTIAQNSFENLGKCANY
jgi:hypothetical protein